MQAATQELMLRRKRRQFAVGQSHEFMQKDLNYVFLSIFRNLFLFLLVSLSISVYPFPWSFAHSISPCVLCCLFTSLFLYFVPLCVLICLFLSIILLSLLFLSHLIFFSLHSFPFRFPFRMIFSLSGSLSVPICVYQFPFLFLSQFPYTCFFQCVFFISVPFLFFPVSIFHLCSSQCPCMLIFLPSTFCVPLSVPVCLFCAP